MGDTNVGQPDAVTTTTSPRWPALDGLRALAIALVVACHLGLNAPGGIIGVDVFFVISGFLITSLLLRESDGTGRIHLRNFWARRALRLFPALACAIVLALAVSLASTAAVRHQTLAGLPLVLFYAGNWARAFGVPQTLGLLGHTWSLAVEEQFYLLWPLACLAFVGRIRRHAKAALVVGALAAADCAYLLYAMAHWGEAQGFFRTDTHAMGLLAGAALALLFGGRRPAISPGERARALLRGVAVAAVGVVLILTEIWAKSPVEQGVMIIIGTGAAAVLVTRLVLDPTGGLHRVFASRPARWIGRRSYGIYLYHYPFAIAFVEMRHWQGWTLVAADVACVMATVALAAASYRWVELPFLRRKVRFSAGDRRGPRRGAAPAPAVR